MSKDDKLAILMKKAEELVGAPLILQRDAALLRERLSWAFKKAPPQIQAYVLEGLQRYASVVQRYCTHPQEVFIASEKAHACLDCGLRCVFAS
jgi:hypothetical protein